MIVLQSWDTATKGGPDERLVGLHDLAAAIGSSFT